MKKLFPALLLLFFVLTYFHGQANGQNPARSYRFDNGKWFDGKSFKAKTVYSVGGYFSGKKPPTIDEVIDLKGGFVVPPFADAHCHHFDGAYNVARQIGIYLTDGVFYAKVQTNLKSGAGQVRDKVNLPTSVDVAYAHGALTHTYGHGIEIYEALALNLLNEKYKDNIAKIAASRTRDNDAYFIIDTAEDLEAKWPRIVAGKPDFIKIYLLTSEEFEERRRKIPNIQLGNLGLDPKLVPAVIDRAHKAGLRVSAHVDTLFDYQLALRAGVDEMSHIPGYYVTPEQPLEKVLLTDEAAKETAKRKIWVIPAPIYFDSKDPARARTDQALKHNLTLLKKHRVRLAFGSDRYNNTPLDDVLYLKKLGVFTNLEMLKIWSEQTPLTIFPNRKIGKLAPGFEASFIVLTENPIDNFEAVKNITFRFKQGNIIRLP